MKLGFGQETTSGVVARIVRRTGHLIAEQFVVVFDDDDGIADYVAWHGRNAQLVDRLTFFESVADDSPVLYHRLVPEGDASRFVEREFGSVLAEDLLDDESVVDLASTPPIDEAEFWTLLRLLDGEASEEGVDRLTSALIKLDPEKIAGFGLRLSGLAIEFNSEGVARQVSESVAFGSDSFLWWRLALIASGRDAVDRVRAGESVGLTENAWLRGENLIGVAERAYEVRTGERPEFPQPPLDPIEGGVSEGFEYDGTVELNSSVAGSYFLLRSSEGLSECVVAHMVDTRIEDHGPEVQQIVRAAAARLGAELASSIHYFVPYGPDLISGLPIFSSKRRYTGTLEQYVADLGIVAIPLSPRLDGG